MTVYRLIGNMTGNSMDAVDLVLTEFDGDRMTDICAYSRPYSRVMQERMEDLRAKVRAKTHAEIEALPEFGPLHDDYIRGIADCVNEMCVANHIAKQSIDAIGFHGKTLDHNPPSVARHNHTRPYTLQMGSGQMLSDLTGLKVVYDFRSALLMSGFEGAPLAPLHNAHIAAAEGDAIYYNGGNTSNFAVISGGKIQIAADSGPFNEYVDNYVRRQAGVPFDQDGRYGAAGKLDVCFMQYMFDLGRGYYDLPLPKSGDPAYYRTEELFSSAAQNNLSFADAVHTFEYFAAYIAVQGLSLIPDTVSMPADIVLFGGGWKNPVVRRSFENILHGRGLILPEHQKSFAALKRRFAVVPRIRPSKFEAYMEARLFADMARYKLEEKAWYIPEVAAAGKRIVCGRTALPNPKQTRAYADRVNLAAKGWQDEFPDAGKTV